MAQDVCVDKAITFVHEYVALLDEGWQPDLEEFVRRVPEPLQEEVFGGIDAALANRGLEDADELLPRTEVIVGHAGGRLAWLSRLTPRDIRHQWLGDTATARDEARDCGLPPFEVALLTAQHVLTGLAQRAPLQMGSVEPDNGMARRARVAWWLSGPALLAGNLFGSGWSLTVATALFLFAWVAVIWFARTEPMPGERAKTFNAVVGGSVVAIGLLVLPGLLTCVTVLGGLALGLPAVASAAVHALAFLATLLLCVITLSGWTPEPWMPTRLIRN